ncbi:MAG: tetratricopeptide repeat protein, partial [Nitrospinae bacterium]|nr:tetratricopeptide repeat protein [Nitrospinota bacterium]
IKDSGAKMFLTSPLSLEIFKERITAMADKMLHDEDEDRTSQLEIIFSSKETMIKSEVRDGIYLKSLANVMRIRRLAPWSVFGRLSEAKIQVGMNDFAGALPTLKGIVQKHFDYKEAHKLLHHCYMRLGKRYAEVGELVLLLEKDPNSAELNLQLGDAYLRGGNYQQAISRYKLVIQQYAHPHPPRFRAKSHVGLGKSLSLMASKENLPQLREEAREEFEKGRKLDPTLLSAYINLAIILREMGREEEARSVMSKIPSVTPSSQEDWISLFEIYLRDGEFVKARAALDRALSGDNNNLKALMEAGFLYMRQDILDEAAKMFEQASVLNPSDKTVYNCIGICLRRLGRFEEALNAYTLAMQLDETDASLYFNKGRVYDEMGEIERAWECYEGALFLDPEMAEAEAAIKNLSTKLCWIDDKTGRYSENPA